MCDKIEQDIDADIERVCRDLRAAPGPLLRANSVRRAREEAIGLIKRLRIALATADGRAREIERTARDELERRVPGYTWPGTPAKKSGSIPPVVDPVATFQAAAEAREAAVTAIHDHSDRRLTETQRILAPGIVNLRKLESELSRTDGVSFSYGVAGHMATVTLNTSVSHHRLTLATDLALRIVVEDYQTFTFERSEDFGNKKYFATVDEAVAYVAEACGRHVGETAALRKRPPCAWQGQSV